MKRGTLYKYLPSKFVDIVRQDGKLLFNNLSYFKIFEDKSRGDELEGTHIDKGLSGQGFDITLQGGRKLKGKQFINSVDTNKIFVFCMSTILEDNLFDEFDSDACIKINNATEFINRCIYSIRKVTNFDDLNYGEVEYYEFEKKTTGNIKDPRKIPLFKPSYYKHQKEFRLFFSIENGFTLRQVITIEGNPFNLQQDETPKCILKNKDIIINIGNIEQLTEVIYKNGT